MAPLPGNKNSSIDTLIFTLVALSVVVVLGGIGLIFFSDDLAEDGWFGSGEMEFINFEEITLTPGPDHYLACAPDFCRNATPDEVTEIFNTPISELRNRLSRFVDGQENIEVKNFDLINLHFVFLVYSSAQPFPDVVTVQLYDLGAPRSGVSILSQTLKGQDENNRNRVRVQRWLNFLRRP